MKKTRYIRTLMIVCAMVFTLIAQTYAEVAVRASVTPATVRIGDAFSLKVEVEGSGVQPEIDAPAELSYRRVGSGMQLVIGLGGPQQIHSSTYRVVASKEGAYTIKVRVKEKDKLYEASPVTVTVKGGIAGGKTPPPTQQPQQRERRGRENEENDFFALATISKQEVYENESVLFYHHLYFSDLLHEEIFERNGNVRNNILIHVPHEAHKDVIRRVFTNGTHDVAEYEKKRYRTYLDSVEVLRPVGGGSVTLTAPTNYIIVEPQSWQARTIPVSRKGKKTFRVRVKPLPTEGQPTNFSGAVGTFTLSVRASVNSVNAYETFSLYISVEGEGSPHSITLPDIKAYISNDIKVYETKESERLALTASNTVHGVKEGEQVIVPQHEGTLVIPAIPFVYFNPETRAYETTTSSPITLTVLKSDKKVDASETLGQGAIQVMGEDIRYIKGKKKRLSTKEKRPIFTTPFPYVYALLWVIALLVAFFYRREQERMSGNARYRRAKKAKGVAKKRLKEAAHLMREHDKVGFYGELEKALLTFITDKLFIPKGAVWETIADALLKKGVDKTTVARVKNAFDTFQYARYAPESGDTVPLDDHYKETAEILRALEEAL